MQDTFTQIDDPACNVETIRKRRVKHLRIEPETKTAASVITGNTFVMDYRRYLIRNRGVVSLWEQLSEHERLKIE